MVQICLSGLHGQAFQVLAASQPEDTLLCCLSRAAAAGPVEVFPRVLSSPLLAMWAETVAKLKKQETQQKWPQFPFTCANTGGLEKRNVSALLGVHAFNGELN